ncbi:hypothetical protein FEM48_Zijuj08G0094400 [Ziziphus jujuba var. spinosa]|uniref:Uncharacterized protein n=1 Tax=Ziziphus jujuba var. spinosa TaxID=714518 RepID=A0A978UYA8_ZIZJJ|nr:hypothetical protein FEM48_Zijuj08G0094400 [Ziziphus jujuba var. spinosa]
MGFGALRSIARPLSRTLLSRASTCSTTSFAATSASPKFELRLVLGGSLRSQAPWFPISNHLHSLTDTRFPKRRPTDKPRRKRASLRPPGPYAWIQSVPGESLLATKPNEGSVKRRNEKKRMRLRHAFILELVTDYVLSSVFTVKTFNSENTNCILNEIEFLNILFLKYFLAEKKKRKAQLQEAKRKKNIKRIERKMAAVARERAWTQRLADLQQLEEEKKKSAA